MAWNDQYYIQKSADRWNRNVCALLAMAGDLGGSIGPCIVGYVTQNSDNNIRVGMGIGLIFPLVLLIMLFILCKGKKTQESIHTV